MDKDKEEIFDYDKVIDGEWDRDDAIRDLRIERLGLKIRHKKHGKKMPRNCIPIVSVVFAVTAIPFILGLKFNSAVTPRRCYECIYKKDDRKYDYQVTDAQKFMAYDDFQSCDQHQIWNGTNNCRSKVRTCQEEDIACGLLVVKKHHYYQGRADIFHETIQLSRNCVSEYPLTYSFRDEGNWLTLRGEYDNVTYVNIHNASSSFPNLHVNISIAYKTCDLFNQCNGQDPKNNMFGQITDSALWTSVRLLWWDLRVMFWEAMPTFMSFAMPGKYVNVTKCGVEEEEEEEYDMETTTRYY